MIPRCLPLFLIWATSLSAQVQDSLIIRQVDSLIRISNSLAVNNEFSKALEVNGEALQIARDSLGPESAGYGNASLNQALTLHRKGELTLAEPWYLKGKSIQEKTMGVDPSRYAGTLNNLAVLYMSLGQYEKAEPLYLKTLAIKEKIQGKGNARYAWSLDNLAYLYFLLGQFDQSEQLYLEADTILASTVGKEHQDYAWNLDNLALLYMHMGQYIRAERAYLAAGDIIEKTQGREHPDYAKNLSNLSILYNETGRFDLAEQLCRESVDLKGRIFGKENPEYASSLSNLASTYLNLGDYEHAEPLLLEALDIKGKTLGHDHFLYAKSLSGMGDIYRETGRFRESEPMYLQSLAIDEHVLGKDHPQHVVDLNKLALLYRDMGRYAQAATCFVQMSSINQTLLRKGILHLSEGELGEYLQTFGRQQNQVLSFTWMTGHEGMAGVCMDNALFYKGFLLSASNRVKRLAYADPDSKEKLFLLKSYERMLAREYAKPIVERDSMQVAGLETTADQLEKDLTREVSGLGDNLRKVTWSDVRQVLRTGEAAVEFVRFPYADRMVTDSMVYAAVLVLPGRTEPEFIPLFEEKAIDSLLTSSGDRRADYVNALYTLADRGFRAEDKKVRTLADLIWAPLEPHLTGVKTVYFSPSGLLHRINLNAIPVSETETLADRINLVELQSTRQLVVPDMPEQGNHTAALFGGIDYETDSTLIAESPFLTARSRGELSFTWVGSDRRGGSWSALASTGTEVKAIGDVASGEGWHVSLYQGGKATEEALKALGGGATPSPQVLHIATHGYFFPDPKTDVASVSGADPVFKISDHPMLRSGLILAGGNAAWRGEPVPEGRDDGVLTAYEISQLDLSNTELVVLSACETGLGDIQGNEGVYGLQRAFRIAGARYLIMSLWQVPDRQTSRLMTMFYRNWLERKMPIPEAFHTAQAELRQMVIDPYQWAGFVLVE